MRLVIRLGILGISGVAVAAGLLVWQDRLQDRGRLTSADVSAAASAGALDEAAALRVFFAHQSVGANLVDGLSGAYAAAGTRAPPVVELSGEPRVPPVLRDTRGGVFAHVLIGENGDPLDKIRDFDAWMRSGVAEEVDVALLKFCYLDVTATTDVNAVFAAYQQSIDALQRDFPDTLLVAVTTPLTTEPALGSRIKGLLGGSNPAPADNAARQRFNALLRSSYAGRVFDLATLESTAPDGSRVTGTSGGETYYALYGGYATDEGHLNRTTSQVAAARLMDFLARQAG